LSAGSSNALRARPGRSYVNPAVDARRICEGLLSATPFRHADRCYRPICDVQIPERAALKQSLTAPQTIIGSEAVLQAQRAGVPESDAAPRRVRPCLGCTGPCGSRAGSPTDDVAHSCRLLLTKSRPDTSTQRLLGDSPQRQRVMQSFTTLDRRLSPTNYCRTDLPWPITSTRWSS